MSATKNSRVSNSLTKMLSSKSTATIEDKGPMTLDENVTSIDQNSEKVIPSEPTSKDPFEEANTADEFIPTVEAEEASELTQSEEPPVTQHTNSENLSNKKPEKIRKKKTALKQSSGVTKALSGSAVALSVIALFGSGYSILSQDSIQKTFSEAIFSVESSIADLVDRSDLIQTGLSGVQRNVSTNTSNIEKLDALQSDLLLIHESMSSIRSEASQVNALLESHKSKLGEYGETISSLQNSVKKLSERPKPVVRRAAAPKSKPKPVVTNSNSVEGASLSTIDRWGAKSYVVLRNENGKWIPLQRGDIYKGWRYTGSTGDQAFFKKGSKTKRLTVES